MWRRCGEASEGRRSRSASQQHPRPFLSSEVRAKLVAGTVNATSLKVSRFLSLNLTLAAYSFAVADSRKCRCITCRTMRRLQLFHFLEFTTSHKRGSSKIGIFEKPFWIECAYPSDASQSQSLIFSCAGKSNPRTEEFQDHLHIPMHTRRTVSTTLALEAMPPVTVTRI